MKRFIIAAMALIPALANAQSDTLRVSSDTLVWTSAQTVDLYSNEAMDYSCLFVSYPNESLHWTTGEDVRILDYVSAEGSWEDTGTDGNITWMVSFGEASGTVKFSRELGQLSLVIDFRGESEEGLYQKFNVSQIQAQ